MGCARPSLYVHLGSFFYFRDISWNDIGLVFRLIIPRTFHSALAFRIPDKYCQGDPLQSTVGDAVSSTRKTRPLSKITHARTQRR